MNESPLSFLQQYIDPNKLIAKYGTLKTARKEWDSIWQIIQDQVFPNYRNYLDGARTSNPQTGKIKNHCGRISGTINKVVSLLNSQICDPSVQWLNLTFGQNALNSNYDARLWLNQCKDTLYALFADPSSEFYTSNYSFYLDWFSLGTSCREIVIQKNTGQIHFATVPMRDIYIELSGYGSVDSIFRRLKLTARQAVSLWGTNLHPSIVQLAQQTETTVDSREFEFFEAVIENPIREQIPSLNYISCVVDKTNKTIVDIGMHDVPPYIVSRFFVAPGETYGRSFVWNAMPDILAINRLSKRILQNIDFATLPITLVRDATSIPQAQLTPGAFVQGLDVNGRPTFQQMQFGGNVPLAMEAYNAKINDLEEALVARDIFAQESPSMTATEVNERKIQASNRLRPMLIRLETEDLSKTVRRTLYLLQQQGQLPPFPYEALEIPPDQLPDPIGMLRVTFSGQMSKMQKMQDISTYDNIFNKAIQLAQVDPSVFDRLKLEELLVKEAEVYGVPETVLNSDKVVAQIREAKQKQADEQQKQQSELAMLDSMVKLKSAGIFDELGM